MFIGRTDAEAETPILWTPDSKGRLIGKDPDVGKTEGKRTRGRQRMRWLNSITNSKPAYTMVYVELSSQLKSIIKI